MKLICVNTSCQEAPDEGNQCFVQLPATWGGYRFGSVEPFSVWLIEIVS